MTKITSVSLWSGGRITMSRGEKRREYFAKDHHALARIRRALKRQPDVTTVWDETWYQTRRAIRYIEGYDLEPTFFEG